MNHSIDHAAHHEAPRQAQHKAPRQVRNRAPHDAPATEAMTTWGDALTEASRAASQALWDWRKRDNRSLSQAAVVRAWDNLMPQSGKSLSPSTLLRYEQPRQQRVRHAELQTVLTMAMLYGHSFADLAAHIDHAIAPYVAHLSRLVGGQVELHLTPSVASREQAMLSAFRRLSDGRQDELVQFAEMLAGGSPAQQAPQTALVEALAEVNGWSGRHPTQANRQTLER